MYTWYVVCEHVCFHFYSRCAIFNMIKRKSKSKTKMMGTCKFTAAACGVDGADGLWAKGERCSMMREDCRRNSSTTQTNTTSTCITSQKKVVPLLHHPTSSPSPLLFFPLHPFFPPAPLQVDQLVCDKLFESLQILSVELHVIVSSPLHPERLHRALTAFVQRQAMGEVDDLVLRAVDHQYW